jgi:hypothetical protein
MRAFALTLAFILMAQAAAAGAWLRDEGRGQVIAEFAFSDADSRFGEADTASFEKVFAKIDCEYGLTEAFTVFVAPQYVWEREKETGYFRLAFATESGGRLRLFSDAGTLSLQTSVTTAGATAAPVAYGGLRDWQGEIRLLYGTDFALFDADGFVDIETAWRWIGLARSNEAVLDATAGLRLTGNDMLMIQNFNIVSVGGAAPYAAYRMHKAELSYVRRFAEGWSVQVGGFFTPAGNRILTERGLKLAIWVDF